MIQASNIFDVRIACHVMHDDGVAMKRHISDILVDSENVM